MAKKSSFIDLSERKLLLRIIDILTIVLSISIASIYTDFSYINISNNLVYGWFLLLLVYYLLFGQIFELYDLKISSNRFLVVKGIVVTSFTTTLVYVFSPYISPSLPENRLQILYFFLLITIPIIIWRFLYIGLLFSPKYFKTIIIIGHASISKSLIELIRFKNFHNIAAYISNEEIDGLKDFNDINTANLSQLVNDNLVTEIVVSPRGFSDELINSLNNQLIQLFAEGINIKSFESYYEEVTDSVPIEYLDYNFYTRINLSKNSHNQFYLFIQRFFDVLISILGLLFFITILPLLLIGNLIGNRGPSFYTQERVGFKGKIFKIYKLRSMIKNAEKEGAVWAKKNDSRITSFGKFLRNTRIDEFPQFVNILKGEMSLIGPRPERPEFVKELKKMIPFYTIRHLIRPGLTGWAQVNFPYANTLEEQQKKVRYDLYYIKERNTFLDFKIIVKTISIVLFFKGQ